jgi:hypothetical protein
MVIIMIASTIILTGVVFANTSPTIDPSGAVATQWGQACGFTGAGHDEDAGDAINAQSSS